MQSCARRGGFSLVEISIVLVVVATMLAGVLPAITESQKTNATSETAERMEAIEQALLTFRSGNGRIPCPASNTASVTNTNFGREAATPGTCTGGTPAANYSGGGAVAGGVPVKALGLPDEYAFDGWGRRIDYHVTTALTATGTFATTTAGVLNIRDSADTNRTTTAAFALVSHGPNGHGGFTRGGTRYNFSTTNDREEENCDCDSSAAYTAFDLILYQYMATPNSNVLESFDDVVRYMSRSQLDLVAGAGGSAGLWMDAGGGNIRNTNTGFVGIGTPNPTSNLEIQGAGASIYAKVRMSSGDGPVAGLALENAGTGGQMWQLIAGNNATGILENRFGISNTPGIYRMVIDQSGNVGIGTPTPATTLDINGGVRLRTVAANGAGLWVDGNTQANRAFIGMQPGSDSIFRLWSQTISQNLIAGDLTTGNIGIGTLAPTETLDIQTPTGTRTGIRLLQNGVYQWWMGMAAGGAYWHLIPNGSGGTAAITVTHTGNVGIGTAAPGQRLDVTDNSSSSIVKIDSAANANAGVFMYEAGSLRFLAYSQNNNDTYYITDADQSHGVYLTQNSSTWQTTSDRRLKENIKPYSVLDKLDNYRAVSFDWKNGGAHDVGVIAQELYEAFPEVVSKGDDDKDRKISKITEPGVWSAKYEQLAALAMQGVKELNDKMKKLEPKAPLVIGNEPQKMAALPQWLLGLLALQSIAIVWLLIDRRRA